MKFKEENVIFRSKDGEWLIAVAVSSKGNVVNVVYYKGMFMGFVNIGDFKTEKMFHNFVFPNVVADAENIKKEYNYKKGDNI